jgi:hypothetical protein
MVHKDEEYGLLGTPKRRTLSDEHDVSSQKVILFIVTAVRTSHPTCIKSLLSRILDAVVYEVLNNDDHEGCYLLGRNTLRSGRS